MNATVSPYNRNIIELDAEHALIRCPKCTLYVSLDTDEHGQKYFGWHLPFGTKTLADAHACLTTYHNVEHNRDSECTVSVETGCCIGCGALHGDACPACQGRGYHNAGCAEVVN